MLMIVTKFSDEGNVCASYLNFLGPKTG